MKTNRLQFNISAWPISQQAVPNKSARLVIQDDFSQVSADVLASSVQSIIADCPNEIIVDVGKIDVIDSSGLRALLVAAQRCSAAGIGFRLENVSACVARIAGISGLSEILGLSECDVPKISIKHDIDLRQENWKTQQFVAESSAQMVGEMRDKIVAQAREAGASGIKLCDIKIAIGEAIANAFRHGSTDSGINLIRVKCRTCKEAFWVEIEDEGETFDPDSVPEPDPNTLKDHGMGIYIMRHTMDVVEYSFNHPGNRVRMVKWLVDD